MPALLLGVAFANLFMGIPIDADGVYHGNLLMLLNPYGLAGGVFFVCIFCMHGALWLRFKAEGELAERARKAAHILWYLVLSLVIAFLALTAHYTFIWTIFPKVLLFIVSLFLPCLLCLASVSSWLMEKALFQLGVAAPCLLLH